jgi:hypothetical protein
MSIDDLKQEWETGAGHANLVLDAATMRVSTIQRARGSLRWLSGVTAFELLANALCLFVLARFALRYRAPRFVIPDACLALLVAANLVSNIRRLLQLHRLDFSGPIVAVQTDLAAIALERVRVTLWTLLVAPLLWTPVLIVGLCWFGVDAYEFLGWDYLGANLLVGAALIPLAIWLSRRYAGTIRSNRGLQRVLDQIAGYSLTRAKAALAELSADGA